MPDAFQRVVRTLVKAAYLCAVEALLVDLEIGADEKLGGHLLDGIADRFRSPGKAPIAYRLAPRCPRANREELSLCFEVEGVHCGAPSIRSRSGSAAKNSCERRRWADRGPRRR